MSSIAKPPCDEGTILAALPGISPNGCGPWVLAATILGSSMAFIDGTVVNVALPALQSALGATVPKCNGSWKPMHFSSPLFSYLAARLAISMAGARSSQPA
jgi:hypothetical protein